MILESNNAGLVALRCAMDVCWLLAILVLVEVVLLSLARNASRMCMHGCVVVVMNER